MDIIWFNEKPKEGIVTLSAGNLTMNKPATTFFENAYSVMLGLDIEKKLIIIKPLLKAEAMSHAIPDNKKYRITVRSSYSRVTNKAFMDQISKQFELSFDDETHKFSAIWDNKDQLLVVDLKGEVK